MQNLFQILEEKSVKHDSLPLNQVLDDLYCIFYQILLKFPPCNLRDSYLEVLTTPLEIDLNRNTSGGIFNVLLDLLSECINSHPATQNRRVSLHRTNSDFSLYHQWEINQETKTSFDSFNRSTKLDRIFMVLDLVLKILETDLANWMVKYSSKMYSYMNRDNRCPMIASLIYQNHDHVMLINSTIKNIITMFVDIVALEYPKAKIDIYSVRLKF